jgi:squalene synthase HpnC
MNQEKLLDNIYLSALQFTKSHYENFPVISYFIPKQLKKHVAIIYQFARQADDIADEGNFSITERLRKIHMYRDDLLKTLNHNPPNEFWTAFYNTCQLYYLTHKNFYDLLSAFEQDIYVSRYSTYDDVLDYCQRSANPVGRIILELFNCSNEKTNKYSDSICTALQLTNFYQDIVLDFKKGRIYIPVNEMKEFGVNENLFELNENNANFNKLLSSQITRTKLLFEEGIKILELLPLNLKFQIKLTILGGMEILNKIEKISFNIFSNRPKLSKYDFIKMTFKMALM